MSKSSNKTPIQMPGVAEDRKITAAAKARITRYIDEAEWLGAKVIEIQAPFDPEGGAYAEPAPAAHAHASHGHDPAHRQLIKEMGCSWQPISNTLFKNRLLFDNDVQHLICIV